MFLLLICRIGNSLVFFLILFGFVRLPGNSFTNGIFLGVSSVVAMLSSGVLMSFYSPLASYRMSLLLPFVSGFALTLIAEPVTVSALLIVSIIGSSAAGNAFSMVTEERTPSEISIQNLEVQLCVSRLFVSLAPQIALLGPPIPMTTLCAVSLSTLLVTTYIATPPTNVPIALIEQNYELRDKGETQRHLKEGEADWENVTQSEMLGVSFKQKE